MEENTPKVFFISYHEQDHERAEWIAWQLEEIGHTCIVKAWDFRPGSNSVLNTDNALKQADRVILVLSPDYLEAAQTQPEWAATFVQDPTGTHKKLLPVRVRECQIEGLLRSIVYIDLVGVDDIIARERLLNGILPGRVKPLEAPVFSGTALHPSSAVLSYPRRNVLIASLGDSPAVISAMYDLLTKRENLSIDRLIVLCPEGEENEDEDVRCAYEQVQRALPELIEEKRLIYKQLPFRDADSWGHGCNFLKILYELLGQHQEKGDTVYLSLAGGRKSMAALMAWVVPFFPCIEKLYHVIDKGEQVRSGSRYFLPVREIAILPDDRFSYVMHPPLDQLILVDIPLEGGLQLGSNIHQKLTSDTINALAKGEYEEEQALIIGQMAIQGGKDPLLAVRVTKEVERQFDLLRMQNPMIARKVISGLLKLSDMEVLQQSGNELDTLSFKLGKSSKAKRLLHYFKELEVPVHPVFYTDPNDLVAYPDRQVNKVVICSLEREASRTYRSLRDVTASPGFSMKDSSDVTNLFVPPEPADSVLIVPLGTSPMVATQLYTLLERREQRTIHEVVLIYPGQSTLINRGAEIIEDMLLNENLLPNKVSCKRVPVPSHRDIDSPTACREFQQILEAQIERVRDEYPLCKVDLALSGGRKGMTAMTIFAAQRQHIPFVYHTLITDEPLSEEIEAKTAEEIEDETTIEKLSETNLTEQQLKDRLFLDDYRLPDEAYPYARFTLFRVPVFAAETK
jgi:hypothetical protein